MAKSINRGLGALAALGALSYHLSKGRGRTDGGAPVDDRNMGAAGNAAATPDVSDPAAMFRAQERAERATPAMPPAALATRAVTPASASTLTPAPAPASASVDPANISADVVRRTGVNLDSMAGAGRGIEGGPALGEIEEFRTNPANISRAVSRRTGVKLDSKAGAGRGGQGGPTSRQLEEYQQEKERERMRGRGYNTARKEGGAIKTKKMASGGMTSASKRADGIATKGKTKCKMY